MSFDLFRDQYSKASLYNHDVVKRESSVRLPCKKLKLAHNKKQKQFDPSDGVRPYLNAKTRH